LLNVQSYIEMSTVEDMAISPRLVKSKLAHNPFSFNNYQNE